MAGSIREALTRAITREPREVAKEAVQQLTEVDMQQKAIATQVQTITPALAQVWMARNTHNRPMSDFVVKKYAKYMTDGQWRLNGEPIIFAKDGSLMSGQHRLQACINSGASFQSVVITGVDRNTFATLDTHRRRTAGDVLSIDGVKNSLRVAAAARAYVRMKHGSWTSRNYTNEQYADFVAKHPSVAKWGAMKRKQDKAFKAYVFGALAAVEDIYGAEIAQSIYDKLVEGVGVVKGDAEQALRNRLTLDKLSEEEGLALTIKAFNFSLEGRTVQRLLYKDTEAFPELIGM